MNVPVCVGQLPVVCVAHKNIRFRSKESCPRQKGWGGFQAKNTSANTGSAENEKNFLLGVVACSSYLRGVTWKKKNLGTCFSSFFSNDGGVTCSAFCFEGGHFSVQFLSSMWR